MQSIISARLVDVMKRNMAVWAVTILVGLACAGQAQAQRAPYGAPISLEQAKAAVTAAEAEARKINVGVAIAVLDSGCNLVLLHRLDNTNLAGTQIAQEKAHSSCSFRNLTKAFQEALAKGGENVRLLQLHGAVSLEGGAPIVVDGKTIGAIGVSGGTSEQDGQIATAGLGGVK
jgi:glc operon protein GlcG